MRSPWKRRRSTPYASSRHADVTRRAALKYGLAAGAGIAVTACANDASVLRDVSIDVTTTTPTTTPPVTPSPTTTPPVSTVAADTLPAVETTAADTVPVPDPLAIAAGSEMLVSFTYQMFGEGKNTSPYTAVWVEDSDGALVQTIALWFDQEPRGRKYLPDLTRWFSVDQARILEGGSDTIDVISSPTRFPGRYSVAWDGVSAELGMILAGDYFVCIEASREDGPHSLIREPIALVGQPIELLLPDATEILAASVSVA